MKKYEFGFYGKCAENNGYKFVKDYIEADNLKNAWIKAAERAFIQFGIDLDSLDLITIIEE